MTNEAIERSIFERCKVRTKLRAKSCDGVAAIDAKSAPYTRYGVGLQKRNPRKCIACGLGIKNGEAWVRDASAEDPDGFGRIVTIRHSPRCPNQKVLRKFQARRNGNH